MRRLLRHLQEEGTVCIFPEGRIASGEHTIHQPGADWLARKSGADVVGMRLVRVMIVAARRKGGGADDAGKTQRALHFFGQFMSNWRL